MKTNEADALLGGDGLVHGILVLEVVGFGKLELSELVALLCNQQHYRENRRKDHGMDLRRLDEGTQTGHHIIRALGVNSLVVVASTKPLTTISYGSNSTGSLPAIVVATILSPVTLHNVTNRDKRGTHGNILVLVCQDVQPSYRGNINKHKMAATASHYYSYREWPKCRPSRECERSRYQSSPRRK